MSSITVETTYTCYAPTDVELPEGYTAADIDGIYMKWGSGEVVFKDGTSFEFEENPDHDADYKRPDVIRAYHCYEDGETNWEEEVYSSVK